MARYLLVKRARLRSGKIVDILIEKGRIARIASELMVENADVIDAQGHLTTPPFCDPHLHLDATLSVETAIQYERNADGGHPHLGRIQGDA